MTKITPAEVIQVAKLARLEIPENELEMYANQLEKIINYVAELEKVDTQNVIPTTRAVEVINMVRSDKIEKTNVREELLDLAPNREGDFFRVPKIL
tara:strand:+ start:1648 stop:1935 length:288 start_codon:yes stop_codon:yes gene_type:complete